MKHAFYSRFSSVQGKAFTLAEYTMNTGDPEFYKKDFENNQAVTMADIKAVYKNILRERTLLKPALYRKEK